MSDISKTNQLNSLFIEWIKSNKIFQNNFNHDGIINEDHFIACKPKILFLTKEANNLGDKPFDVRIEWAKQIKYTFSIRIFEWAFGILNNFPPLESIPFDDQIRLNTISRISFMNIKKTPGGSKSNLDDIKQFILRDRGFILREIEIINPDIIVGGIGNSKLWNNIFDNIVFIKSGYDVNFFKWKDIKVIDYYHPSYRVPRAMLYLLLENVLNSKYFIEL